MTLKRFLDLLNTFSVNARNRKSLYACFAVYLNIFIRIFKIIFREHNNGFYALIYRKRRHPVNDKKNRLGLTHRGNYKDSVNVCNGRSDKNTASFKNLINCVLGIVVDADFNSVTCKRLYPRLTEHAPCLTLVYFTVGFHIVEAADAFYYNSFNHGHYMPSFCPTTMVTTVSGE